MKRFSRYRKSKARAVRWLPDTSFMQSTTRHIFNQASGATLSYKADYNLIRDDVPIPSNLQDQQASVLGVSAGRRATSEDTLIIDHIKGKVSWALDGTGDGGTIPDASGLWMFVIRMGIALIPSANQTALGATVAPITTAGEQWTLSNLLDPGGAIQCINAGSSGPEGVRILWRRVWMLTGRLGGGFNSSSTGLDALCPGPTGYIDIKPKRLFKPNDSLVVGIHAQAVPLISATDGCGITWGSDLRVAAHNTSRRR